MDAHETFDNADDDISLVELLEFRVLATFGVIEMATVDPDAHPAVLEALRTEFGAAVDTWLLGLTHRP